MITGIDWYEYQIKEKTKQLKKHNFLAEISQDETLRETYKQLAYDDEQYLIMLKYSMQNSMWYKDERYG